ncbi:MAG: hypothetical protein IPM04_09045 [Saprospiraceae bacterium]|nr:hypothetical protein [Candidatus Brachybacter algidus]MBK8748003.1 hypothetical protein [Candidatus Brachybacter algidus]
MIDIKMTTSGLWVKGYLDEEYGIEVKDEEITRALIAEINSYLEVSIFLNTHV